MSGSKRRLLVFIAATAAVSPSEAVRTQVTPPSEVRQAADQPEGFGLDSIPGVPRR